MPLTIPEILAIGRKIGAISAGIADLLPPSAEESAHAALNVIAAAFDKSGPKRRKVTREEMRDISKALLTLLREVWGAYGDSDVEDVERFDALIDQIVDLGETVVAEWRD